MIKSKRSSSLFIRGSLLSIAASIPATDALAGWSTVNLTEMSAAWEVAVSAGITYVGGSDNRAVPGLWQKKGSRWTRIYNSPSNAGTINTVSVDNSGLVNFTAQGTTYGWSSDILQYNPKTTSWSKRGVGNETTYSRAQAYDYNQLFLAGKTVEPVPGVWPSVGDLNIYLGGTREIVHFTDAALFSAVAYDPIKGVFVAGINSHGNPDNPNPDAGQPGLWFYNGFGTFTKLDLPSTVGEITYMVSNTGIKNSDNSLYFSGSDKNGDAHVWKYGNAGSTDTGLTTQGIAALAVDGQGGIIAGGINTDQKGQVSRYSEKKNKWVDLKLKNSAYVRGVFAQGNTVYSVGADSQGNPKLWIYK